MKAVWKTPDLLENNSIEQSEWQEGFHKEQPNRDNFSRWDLKTRKCAVLDLLF